MSIQFYLRLNLVHLQQMSELADETDPRVVVDGGCGVGGDETVVLGQEVGHEAKQEAGGLIGAGQEVEQEVGQAEEQEVGQEAGLNSGRQ